MVKYWDIFYKDACTGDCVKGTYEQVLNFVKSRFKERKEHGAPLPKDVKTFEDFAIIEEVDDDDFLDSIGDVPENDKWHLQHKDEYFKIL